MLRLFAALTAQTALFIALIMGPAWALTGSMNWPRGWLTIVIMFASSTVGSLWLARTDPELVRERTSIRPQSRADTLATLLIAVSLVAWLAVTAWDVHRLRLLALPPGVSLGAGLALFSIGLFIIVWAFRVNSFAATVVKIQGARQQRVIDTGPYALVRHPMYLGAIPFCAGIALLLESTVGALVALPLFVVAFLPRMRIEEATLRRDLAGYPEYQSRVRARILPGVF